VQTFHDSEHCTDFYLIIKTERKPIFVRHFVIPNIELITV